MTTDAVAPFAHSFLHFAVFFFFFTVNEDEFIAIMKSEDDL